MSPLQRNIRWHAPIAFSYLLFRLIDSCDDGHGPLVFRNTVYRIVDAEDEVEVIGWCRQPVVRMLCVWLMRDIDVKRAIGIELPFVTVGDVVTVQIVVVQEVILAIERNAPEAVCFGFWPVVRTDVQAVVVVSIEVQTF